MIERRRSLFQKVNSSPVDYLKFTAAESCTFSLYIPAQVDASCISYVEYSMDDGETWVRTANDSSTRTITTPSVPQGAHVLWRGEGVKTAYSTSSCSIFSSTGFFYASGSVTSLLYGDKNIKKLNTSYTFARLFINNAKIVTPPALPATTLADYCYYEMFHGCTSLTVAPALPATTLAKGCYYEMFRNCSNLTSGPTILPATTLNTSCYYSMFYDCTSLTSAPELPAMTLENYCYGCMFYGCTSLTSAPELPAMTLVSYCYDLMFYGCTSLNYIKALFTNVPSGLNSIRNWVNGVSFTGTFVKSIDATWNDVGDSGVPLGWNVRFDFNAICFTAVTSSTFKFVGSVVSNTLSYSLDKGKTWTELANNTSCPLITAGNKIWWKGNCNPQVNSGIGTFISSGTFDVSGNIKSLLFGEDYDNYMSLSGYNYAFYELFAGSGAVNADALLFDVTTLAEHCYERMFYNCQSLVSSPDLSLTSLTPYCYSEMFKGCTSLTVAPALPATTLANGCYSEMFKGCSSLSASPNLPATTLVQGCYNGMFDGCSSLNSIKALFLTEPSSVYTENWVNGVSSTGTFVKSPDAIWNVTGINGVPIGWSVIATRCDVDLLDSWTTSTKYGSLSSEGYDFYQSTNKTASSKGQMKITISGYTEFAFKVRNYSESGYDYVVVNNLDDTSMPSWQPAQGSGIASSGKVFYTNKGKSSSTAWSDVVFNNLDGGEHVIYITYGKDSSTNSNDDEGYVAIPKS